MSARVTLNGIKQRGLANWKAREAWFRKNVRIWSNEHQAWWRPNRAGYTAYREAAGIYTFAEAWAATEGCGPEKKIVYEAVW